MLFICGRWESGPIGARELTSCYTKENRLCSSPGQHNRIEWTMLTGALVNQPKERELVLTLFDIWWKR